LDSVNSGLLFVEGALDEPLMTSTVKNIVAKRTVTVPNYDFMTHCRSLILRYCITVSTVAHLYAVLFSLTKCQNVKFCCCCCLC